MPDISGKTLRMIIAVNLFKIKYPVTAFSILPLTQCLENEVKLIRCLRVAKPLSKNYPLLLRKLIVKES